MMTIELNGRQRLAVAHPLESSLAILGSPRSGKTTALLERARRADPATALILPDFAQLAGEIYEALGSSAPREIDSVEAEGLLFEAAESLYDLSWEEFEQAQIDPEVGGARMRQRFLASAFRLICRLRSALITPGQFLQTALAGATAFYAKPPNFADTNLILNTKDHYRDSLDVSPDELKRQYRHEVDLAKILARVYESYLSATTERAAGTRHDLIAGAAELLERDPVAAGLLRARYATAFVDDAQHLTFAEGRLIRLIFGEDLRGVTLAGDERSCVAAFGSARPDVAFEGVAERIELPGLGSAPPKRETHRADTPLDEAKAIARHVSGLIAGGTPPSEIAVLFRSVRTVTGIEQALLDRNVPVQIAGDYNVFTDRRSLDAIALLWNVYDPFRHDWMLRTLSGPSIGLSDASLAVLCSPAPDAQDPLFPLTEPPENPARPSRWDPRRDLRLGWNVLRGTQDATLSAEARFRLEAFRTRREHWVHIFESQPFDVFVRAVWSEGLARDGTPNSARALSQQVMLGRLSAWFAAFFERRPEATVGDLLEELERRARSDYERIAALSDDRFVSLLSIEAAGGRDFAHVVVANVQAGAFPQYYVPDAFLFSPGLGIVPKDNVGEARSARTAKFTYYMFKAKTRDRYNLHERRAFQYALSRARTSVLVTASGRATRGVAAPELLEELRLASG